MIGRGVHTPGQMLHLLGQQLGGLVELVGHLGDLVGDHQQVLALLLDVLAVLLLAGQVDEHADGAHGPALGVVEGRSLEVQREDGAVRPREVELAS